MNGLFHIAFATGNVRLAKSFYSKLLGCKAGRESTNWVDFNFFGHQMSIHKVTNVVESQRNYYNPKTSMPANHFGVVLSMSDWEAMRDRIIKHNYPFSVRPQTVFEGEIHEQNTFFLRDPDGNEIEFKAFANPANVFVKE